MNQNIKNKIYWNKKYIKYHSNNYPSQFSTFVLNELSNNKYCILDCGCGNGRDTFFFSLFNKKIYGIDSSSSAINICKKKKKINKLNSKFLITDFEKKNEVIKLGEKLKKENADYIIYSRFFIHAITKNAEKNFFKLTNLVCGKNSKIFLEFRTTKDKENKKTYSDHYRRFIDIKLFKQIVNKNKFNIEYFIQGKGLAKYLKEDPYVARLILSKK